MSRPPRKREAAADFLREALANGPRPVAEIRLAAEALGIARMTLERAATELGIRSHPRRRGPGGGWEWSL